MNFNLQLFGGGGGSSGGSFRTIGRNLPRKGKPNSQRYLYNKQGEKLQKRYYDKNGDALKDIDFKHGEKPGSHKFPHEHEWNNGIRGKGFWRDSNGNKHYFN